MDGKQRDVTKTLRVKYSKPWAAADKLSKQLKQPKETFPN